MPKHNNGILSYLKSSKSKSLAVGLALSARILLKNKGNHDEDIKKYGEKFLYSYNIMNDFEEGYVNKNYKGVYFDNCNLTSTALANLKKHINKVLSPRDIHDAMSITVFDVIRERHPQFIKKNSIPEKINDLTPSHLKDIYYEFYYKPYDLDKIENDVMRTFIFDTKVNHEKRIAEDIIISAVNEELNLKVEIFQDAIKEIISSDIQDVKKIAKNSAKRRVDIIKKSSKKETSLLVRADFWLTQAENI